MFWGNNPFYVQAFPVRPPLPCPHTDVSGLLQPSLTGSQLLFSSIQTHTPSLHAQLRLPQTEGSYSPCVAITVTRCSSGTRELEHFASNAADIQVFWSQEGSLSGSGPSQRGKTSLRDRSHFDSFPHKEMEMSGQRGFNIPLIPKKLVTRNTWTLPSWSRTRST